MFSIWVKREPSLVADASNSSFYIIFALGPGFIVRISQCVSTAIQEFSSSLSAYPGTSGRGPTKLLLPMSALRRLADATRSFSGPMVTKLPTLRRHDYCCTIVTENDVLLLRKTLHSILPKMLHSQLPLTWPRPQCKKAYLTNSQGLSIFRFP